MDKEVVDRIVAHLRAALTPAQLRLLIRELAKEDDGWCVIVRGARL